VELYFQYIQYIQEQSVSLTIPYFRIFSMIRALCYWTWVVLLLLLYVILFVGFYLMYLFSCSLCVTDLIGCCATRES
jgi:hypothetical protein